MRTGGMSFIVEGEGFFRCSACRKPMSIGHVCGDDLKPCGRCGYVDAPGRTSVVMIHKTDKPVPRNHISELLCFACALWVEKEITGRSPAPENGEGGPGVNDPGGGVREDVATTEGKPRR